MMENEKNALRTDAEKQHQDNNNQTTTASTTRTSTKHQHNHNQATTASTARTTTVLMNGKYEREESALTVRGTVFAPPTGHKAKNNALSCHTSPAPLILTLTCLVSANMCFLRGGASVVQKLFSRSRPTARPLERNVNIKGAGGIKPTRLHQ